MEIANMIKEQLYYKLADEFRPKELTERDFRVLEFNDSIRIISNDLNAVCSTKEEQINLLNSYIMILKESIKYETISEFMLGDKNPIKHLYCVFEYKDSEGNVQRIGEENIIELDIAKTCTLTKPWSAEKFKRAVERKEDFVFDSTNHYVEYWKTLDMAFVCNGFHSTTEGVVNRKRAMVQARCYNDFPLFENLYTDGVNWYNKLDDSNAGEIVATNSVALKFALIFTLIQKRLELEGKIENKALNYNCLQRKSSESICWNVVNELNKKLTASECSLSYKIDRNEYKHKDYVSIYAREYKTNRACFLTEVEIRNDEEAMIKEIKQTMRIPFTNNLNFRRTLHTLKNEKS